MPVLNKINDRIVELKSRESEIPTERKDLLKQFAVYISGKLSRGEEANLIFICTHNSRRSHISQIWAQTASEYYGIKNVVCYSGGTEVSEFNSSAIKALVEAGFIIKKEENSPNPVYLVSYSDERPPVKCFSKIYSDPFNPQLDFTAIMTCSDADENCPIVHGASERFPIRYTDPKIYDNTEIENEKYKDTINQIGIEMLYVFKNVIVV